MFSVCNQIFQGQFREQQKSNSKKHTTINIKVNDSDKYDTDLFNTKMLNTIHKLERENDNVIISDCKYVKNVDDNTKLYKCIKYVK
tara:strand:+ start:8742 stop:8999 length:258 start_codon:yes stop_codon:yes gene_type:complete